MRKILQPPQGVRVPVFRLKDHRGFQRVHQAALARNAEFGGEIAVDAGNDPHGKFLRHGYPSLPKFC